MNAKSPQGFYLDPETIRALDERAKEEGVSRSELIVEYIARRMASGPPPPARETPGAAGVLSQIYLDRQMSLNLADRAEFEGVGAAELIVQSCLDGLALPATGGEAARKAGERLVVFYRSRIDEFLCRARVANERAVEEIDKLRKACPHARLVETADCWVDDIYLGDDHRGCEGRMCEDCGLAEGSLPESPYDVLVRAPSRIVDRDEFSRLYGAHPYRRLKP